MKGFTLIELIIVIALMGIVTAVGAAKYTEYDKDQKIEKAAYKIKYDIEYLKNQKMSNTRNYMIGFSINVNDIDAGTHLYDYACFIDKDNDNTPDFKNGGDALNDSSQNEILKDPLTQEYMMYEFGDKLTGNENSKTQGIFNHVRLKEVRLYAPDTTAAYNNLIWFDKFGGPNTRTATSTWGAILMDNTHINNIMLELIKDTTYTRTITIYPLTSEMTIN